ncbi:type 1 glutamine amidotransferase [Ponticoccus sp. SC2-23]|uniref:type 1 glutamine amidotransferase n=1 Tax=Alexandriicola marinus TaxID=2081710 RepID=UPI000FD82E48|nr:type 1 glutamine amidotransferase [Alexandriicola marinus]MBM1220935.1 type 1 glutamine amidotransferase [Ponticoccus sp. SC6-9]MBM1225505.1 type 1 glutamine amidotransferase [Ponticoccus sp. SC6-15]MBM1227688.1 type 1 glutamine amidotransferase [Ponticoccus sp. SC6-38]MBM1234674.1 type 1 glutamine amidotransferase [Ponticoccus sp. SC6-45]MBM1238190.1 type 1 glutamine amidotransferase [Ponticoccus sp. SC6-49]MBM1244177.1 type 1 glutamine amidotransferase [Ponticoccus sp. SC2-64]MBM1248198
MRIAILITNTDDSAFSRARPDDGEKFGTLIAEVRPDWTTTPVWVCRDEWPEDITHYDGVLITGSPASVNDDAPWIARLSDLIGQIMAARLPLFGACFGHQLIAKTMGAGIVRNPDGWGHGLLHVSRTARAPWSGPETEFALYGSHIEQVDRLPDGATHLFEGPGLPIAGFAVDDHVATIQHHPEMTHDFITDLVEEYADYVGPEVTARARASLAQRADRAAFAAEIARFFEHARAARG